MLKRERINAFLKLNQLATLADPRNLLAQLAMGIRTHEKFRGMLLRVEPEKRRAAYDAMRSRLRFEAKPLEVYIAEGAAIAEREQWPIYDNKTGTTKSFEAQNLDTLAQDAIRKAAKSLTVNCRRCTREAKFPAKTKSEAYRAAAKAGWTVENAGPRLGIKPGTTTARTLCPECTQERVQ